MTQQPEALRLAELLDEGNAAVYRKHATEAAAELRRLIAKIADLEEAARVLSEVVAERNQLEAQRDELRDRLAQPEQEPVALPRQMTPEMIQKVQMHSELGAYAADNWADAYDTFQEFWQVAISALPAPPQRKPLTDELLETLEEIAYGLESARVWGGMDWSYNPLYPHKYLPLRDKARAAVDKFVDNKHD